MSIVERRQETSVIPMVTPSSEAENMNNDYDFIGIGAGVCNLSLAALIEDRDLGRYVFLERKPEFAWHENSALEMADMQTIAIKDLVTPAEPTNRFSFLNYLFSRGILEQFFNRNSFIVSRAQFNAYLKWVAENVTSIEYNVAVSAVSFEHGRFLIQGGGKTYSARHLVIGTGLRPHVPAVTEPFLGSSLYHSSRYSDNRKNYDGKSVAVVGGGTSGAEIFYDVIAKYSPAKVVLLSERSRLAPLEESCFTNECFTSSFVRRFHGLPADKREWINSDLLLAGDGITPGLSSQIYHTIYEKKYFSHQQTEFIIRCNSSLVGVRQENGRYRLIIRSMLTDEVDEQTVDEVILATGYRTCGFDLLSGLCAEYPELAERRLNLDYSVSWRRQGENNIFIQNDGRRSHGVPDPYLSLAAWRASVIANGLAKRELFRTKHAEPVMHV